MKHEVTFLTVPRSLRKAVKKLVRVLMSPPKMHFVVNFVATEVLVWKKKALTEFGDASEKAVCRKETYTKHRSYKDRTWSLVGEVDDRAQDTIIEAKNRAHHFIRNLAGKVTW